ncbi:preprotein translocase subunit SecG [Brevibacterium otitidis]|uniref:Protein-export membrane protein SecG n=1 Tax=Brevibacterium otitidis TaxID=53364 RepID=A0ABV5X2N9_9MICO|nr:hypothetical protein GCM10023233_12170 [Brevibacterium otitidis]
MDSILTWTLTSILVLTSIFLTLLILLHKGKGGGMSDMFGGGMSSNLGSSGVAERNLNRFTTLVAIVWVASIVLLGLMVRFQG